MHTRGFLLVARQRGGAWKAVAQLSPTPLPGAALCPLEPPRLLIAAPGAQLQQQPSLASSSALGEPCLTEVMGLMPGQRAVV